MKFKKGDRVKYVGEDYEYKFFFRENNILNKLKVMEIDKHHCLVGISIGKSLFIKKENLKLKKSKVKRL